MEEPTWLNNLKFSEVEIDFGLDSGLKANEVMELIHYTHYLQSRIKELSEDATAMADALLGMPDEAWVDCGFGERLEEIANVYWSKRDKSNEE
jgi:hypothetical protein